MSMRSISLSELKRNSSSLFVYHLSLSFSSSSSSSADPKQQLSLLLSDRLSSPHLHQIHARIFRLGYDQDNLLATKLIGHLQFLAPLVFHRLCNPNIFPFNAIIRVQPQNAFSFFKNLKNRSVTPNEFTFSFLLKAFFRLPVSNHVRQIHTHVVKSGFDRDPFVKSGLLAVYARAIRDTCSARQVFDEMPDRNGVSYWTLLISCYSKFGRSEEALTLFLRMLEQSLKPENDTMVSVLSACSSLEAQEIKKWETIFLQKLQQFDDDDINDSIKTVLVYLYGKRGKIETARELFDKMSQRRKGGASSVVVWNSMIGGCAQNGFPMEALDLFRRMVQGSNSKPNHVTMVSVLSACSQVGDLNLGKWIHEYIVSSFPRCVLETNPFLATAFIDMYAKCGSLDSARQVFDRMVKKDVVCFNAMIMGLAINGQGQEALSLFFTMQSFGASPTDGTFIAVLCACTHAGLVFEGRLCFASMKQCYKITPKVEHYACFIDLLARSGKVEEALEVAKSMPIEPNCLVWGTLLSACLIHSKLDLAIDVARKLVDIDPENSGAYVLLSNVYAEDSQWGKIAELRTRMKERRVRKQPGRSWISVDGVVHEFLVGSTSHPEIQRIYHTLNVLFNEMNKPSYLP